MINEKRETLKKKNGDSYLYSKTTRVRSHRIYGIGISGTRVQIVPVAGEAAERDARPGAVVAFDVRAAGNGAQNRPRWPLARCRLLEERHRRRNRQPALAVGRLPPRVAADRR